MKKLLLLFVSTLLVSAAFAQRTGGAGEERHFALEGAAAHGQARRTRSNSSNSAGTLSGFERGRPVATGKSCSEGTTSSTRERCRRGAARRGPATGKSR